MSAFEDFYNDEVLENLLNVDSDDFDFKAWCDDYPPDELEGLIDEYISINVRDDVRFPSKQAHYVFNYVVTGNASTRTGRTTSLITSIKAYDLWHCEGLQG